MRLKNRLEESFGFEDYLTSLLGHEISDDKTGGIARKVIADGEDSLSSKQRYVFHEHAIKPFGQRECTLCHDMIPWEEMIGACFRVLCDEPWLCSHCDNLLSQD